MNRNLKHITFFLLLVFLVPTVYQSWHIVHHHSEKNCDSTLEHHADGVNSEKDDYCFICEYTFSSNDLPLEQSIGFDQIIFADLNIGRVSSETKCFSQNAISPRAPPVL